MKLLAFAMYLTNKIFLIFMVSSAVFSNQTLMKRESLAKFEFDFIRILKISFAHIAL